jgi:hypothetical protein
VPTQPEKLPDQLTTAVDTRSGGGRKVTKVTSSRNLGRKLGLAIFGLTGLILTRQPIFIGTARLGSGGTPSSILRSEASPSLDERNIWGTRVQDPWRRAVCNACRNTAASLMGGWQLDPEHSTANDFPDPNRGRPGSVEASAGGRFSATT